VKWWQEQGPTSDINNGVAVAGWIHSALVDGQASAWLWWWYQASGTDDNEGLLLKSGTDTKRHYTLGNYSKFIRPGYMRVDITGTVPSGVLLSAYKGSDGTVVVVAINKSTGSATVPISIAGGTVPASCTPWVTSTSANLTSGTAVAVSGGSFSASLASATVTSFVCK
jgi:glucuronoarabinoxylan endo-1,4-beta-xylanase